MTTETQDQVWIPARHQAALRRLFKNLHAVGFKLHAATDGEEWTDARPSYQETLHMITRCEMGAIEFKRGGFKPYTFHLQTITFNDEIVDNVPDWSWDADTPQEIQDDFERVMVAWYAAEDSE